MDFIPKVKPDKNKETLEEDPNFKYSDEELEVDDYEADDSEIVIEEMEEFIPKAKKVSVKEDLFEDDDDKETKQPTINKNGKQRKPMTEEHKQKLKFAREKAMLAKKAKAQERKVQKAEDAEENKLLLLKKKKDKKKEMEKLKKEVYEEDDILKEQIEPVPIVREIIREPTLTKKDIEDAQLNAIMSYESLRKQRKEDKKKKEKEQEEYNNLKNKLLRAQNPRNQFSGSRGFF